MSELMQLHGEGVAKFGSEIAALWGFPREIAEHEIEDGIWFAETQDHEILMVWWIEITGLDCGGIGVHYVVRPQSRKRWDVRRWVDHVISETRKRDFDHIHAAVPAKLVEYILRYVDIWNRRHSDQIGLESIAELDDEMFFVTVRL